jgi:hypothetical protein
MAPTFTQTHAGTELIGHPVHPCRPSAPLYVDYCGCPVNWHHAAALHSARWALLDLLGGLILFAVFAAAMGKLGGH